jgi:hypothetical protein
MNKLGTGLDDIHSAFSHAMYEGFPEYTYEDRDWVHYSKTKEDKRIVKSHRHSENDIEIYAMFPQIWGSTALGFGGMGGAAITTAYTTILQSNKGYGYCVYFSGIFAYRIAKPNEKFYDDMTKRVMTNVKDAKQLYEHTNNENV